MRSLESIQKVLINVFQKLLIIGTAFLKREKAEVL